MKRYHVIGGQYESCWHGETDSLHSAKCLAARSEEYWDNWKGWHRPAIYTSDHVAIVESAHRITSPDGMLIIVPTGDPAYVYDDRLKRWREYR